MANLQPSRRRFLGGLGAAGTAALLSGCVTSTSSGKSSSKGNVTLQSNLSAPQAKTAMEDIVAAYAKKGSGKASLNTVAAETFRTQLPTYLTSANPPDVYTWYPGSVADAYAKKNLLLDLDEVWNSSHDLKRYSKAQNKLCTSSAGKKVFVPATYYWWGMFYRKSNFAKWGVRELPKSWDDFLDLCDKLKSKGIAPIGLGAGGNTPWVASAWFDYLDIRINGAQYHRELLAGKHRFDDPEVRKVFDRWQEVHRYFDPNGTALAFQDATTALLNGKTGMMLIGTFFADSAPKNALDDIDFFRFPIIDAKVPLAEEAPVDGYFASARTGRREQVYDLMRYLATVEAQETYIKGSSGTVLPCNPDAKDAGTALVKKGRAHVASATEITQFFNRDSSDALQPTADTALTKFLAKPQQIGSILTDWQRDAEKIWNA
ncbi:extracellular solute-binding protein [Streptomyces spinosirectus]|jgi:multiple sugar transport system substrate-binding protein|uniref:ABC transporter substrate-binding protein n=1 Tax=Streptomyces TaxID=1883 RepID=UPI000D33C404|nr:MULTISPECIES: extracellular solute-binding protein [Streptomyces]MBY8338613.1 extracellular solute-binding protein [Streptomyces plumbidurans]PTM96936.1 carbohydrate ABC transporter substrate-binding protein (CUT1 family) [Streptomyces sp. VMFN-G11Ma]UIR16489.1 extracellular solute-binding protein [Streptomyces spinosirectus]